VVAVVGAELVDGGALEGAEALLEGYDLGAGVIGAFGLVAGSVEGGEDAEELRAFFDGDAAATFVRGGGLGLLARDRGDGEYENQS
jgi:hypothetical protein